MVSDKLGHIRNKMYKLGIAECPIFIFDSAKPVVFDAGVSCAGKMYVEAIRSVLGDREPALLLLTHAHWDHCGAVAYLKNAFPQMKVAASPLAVDILRRPNALALIHKLNDEIAARFTSLAEFNSQSLNDSFAPFEIDIEINDNHVIDLGGSTTIEVLATPGHTKDHLSFYMPNEQILVAGEAGGVYYNSEVVSTEFVFDYDAYLSSLRRLAALPAEVFLQGHYQHLIGKEEVSAFFERSIKETQFFKARVLELLNKEDSSIEYVIKRLKMERYDIIQGPKQPEFAYLINLKAQVSHLAARNSSN